jgi:hypothetical protein
MLAQHYIRSDLTDLDRYHAKFGDVGVNYIKRALPSLKIPKQYRCEFCIDGKIHKFRHGPCAGLNIYLVCVSTLTTYAKSIGGWRYFQLYLPVGIPYDEEDWSLRGDPQGVPGLCCPIWKASANFSIGWGRSFMSQENKALLTDKVRHEFSAP